MKNWDENLEDKEDITEMENFCYCRSILGPDFVLKWVSFQFKIDEKDRNQIYASYVILNLKI